MENQDQAVAVFAPKRGLFQAVVAVAVVALTNTAMAAGEITALGEGASDNMSAALTIALGIFAVGVGVIGAFKGYDYLKAGIKKA